MTDRYFLVSLDVGAMGRVDIRPATSSDADGWIELLRIVTDEGPFLALERIDLRRRDMARFLKQRAWSNDAASIVAVNNTRVIGQISVIRDKGIYTHIAEIGMSVHADFRRKGIGRALIDAAVKWGKAFGIEKLTLQVFPHNEAALALYRSTGFSEEGHRIRQAKLSYGYEDLIEMGRFI